MSFTLHFLIDRGTRVQTFGGAETFKARIWRLGVATISCATSGGLFFMPFFCWLWCRRKVEITKISVLYCIWVITVCINDALEFSECFHVCISFDPYASPACSVLQLCSECVEQSKVPHSLWARNRGRTDRRGHHPHGSSCCSGKMETWTKIICFEIWWGL